MSGITSLLFLGAPSVTTDKILYQDITQRNIFSLKNCDHGYYLQMI